MSAQHDIRLFLADVDGSAGDQGQGADRGGEGGGAGAASTPASRSPSPAGGRREA